MAAIVYLLTLAPADLSGTLPGLLWLWSYLGNWAQAFNWPGGQLGLMGHTWTLAVEEQFYWIWPIALSLILRYSPTRQAATLRVLALTVVFVTWWQICAAHNISENTAYFRTDTNASSLLIGCTLALWLSEGPRPPKYPWLALIIGGAAVLEMFVDPTGWVIPEGGSFQVALATTLIVWTCTTGLPRAADAVLSWAPLVYIGRISYGLYLWHFPLYLAYDQVPWFAEHPLEYWLAKILVPVAVASLSWFVLEQPILAGRGPLGRRFDAVTSAARVEHSAV